MLKSTHTDNQGRRVTRRVGTAAQIRADKCCDNYCGDLCTVGVGLAFAMLVGGICLTAAETFTGSPREVFRGVGGFGSFIGVAICLRGFHSLYKRCNKNNHENSSPNTTNMTDAEGLQTQIHHV